MMPALILALVGLVFGVLIGLASKYFAVEADDRVEKVLEMLPGYNCGACGHPGCAGLAEAIVNEGANPVLCKPGKEEMRNKIKRFLEEQSI